MTACKRCRHRPASAGLATCERCRAYMRAYKRSYRETLREYMKCRDCCARLDEGVHCLACRLKRKLAARAARQADAGRTRLPPEVTP